VRRVPVNSPYVARDMDTWEDYRQLHEDVFGSAPPVSWPILGRFQRSPTRPTRDTS